MTTSNVSLRNLFFKHVAQTSNTPMGLEVSHAKGIYLYTTDGRKFIDLVSGVSVSSVGHCHPKVVQAVQRQAEQYMHLMVYGEYIQNPQVLLAQKLCSKLHQNLPDYDSQASLQSVYYVSSGSEANEGAMKLAKRHTRRTETIAFKNAYHGSTQGALSLMGNEAWKQNFRPLLPDVRFLDFNDEAQLKQITERTACVIAEPIQAEAGIRLPQNSFLEKLRERCTAVGALLVFDEVQTGMGRTGSLFAFERYGVRPDILTIGKAFGGGMPLAAFIASPDIMRGLANPALGHITTFGGHPVSCAAGLAALEALEEDSLLEQVEEKSRRFRERMSAHPQVKEVRGEGLLLAVELGDAEKVQTFFQKTSQHGVAIDCFLFCNTAFRIAPPLTITHEEIDEVCEVLYRCLA